MKIFDFILEIISTFIVMNFQKILTSDYIKYPLKGYFAIITLFIVGFGIFGAIQTKKVSETFSCMRIGALCGMTSPFWVSKWLYNGCPKNFDYNCFNIVHIKITDDSDLEKKE